jgi:hypothetical protein
MRSEKVDRFLKTKDCPPSEDLLSFLATFPFESTSEIISHLDVCDFVPPKHTFQSFKQQSLSGPLPTSPRIFDCWQNRYCESDLQRSNYSVRNLREGVVKSRLLLI